MKNIPTIFSRIAIVTGLTLGAFAISALADFSAPVSSPPTCPAGSPGCDAPLNVGLNIQSKLGKLLINTDVTNPYVTGLEVWGNTMLRGGLTLPTGAAAGKVLTSDASGNGTWQAVAGAGTNAGWITIDSGALRWADNVSVYWKDTVNHSPSKMCQNAGYVGAAGACTGTVSGTTYDSTYMANNVGVGGGRWSFACPWGTGSGNFVLTALDSKILCVK